MLKKYPIPIVKPKNKFYLQKNGKYKLFTDMATIDAKVLNMILTYERTGILPIDIDT